MLDVAIQDGPVKNLLARVETYLPQERVAFVREAYDFAANAHQGQARLSGDPYILHPLETALYLAELHLDATTIIALCRSQFRQHDFACAGIAGNVSI